MGAPMFSGQMAVLLLLLLLPEFAFCGCILGSNNTQDIILRNNTILTLMNNTLMNHTTFFDGKIRSFSNFQLWNHIMKTINVTAGNYLSEGASMGKLLTINWTSATQLAQTNWTDGRTLAAYIRGEFVDPAHNKLQEMAVYYSFSLGIFRPRQMQSNYSGTDPMNKPPLNLTCKAGSRFLWRLLSTMLYDPKYADRRSILFARLATVIERSFDQYYRTHAELGSDFIRVNVLDAHLFGTNLAIHMEAYFINRYLATSISLLTDVLRIPAIYLNGGLTRLTLIQFSARTPIASYVVNSTTFEIHAATVGTTASTGMTSTGKVTTLTSINASGSTTTVGKILTSLPSNSSVAIANSTTRIINSTANHNSTTSLTSNTTATSQITNTTLNASGVPTSSLANQLTNASSTISPFRNISTEIMLETNVPNSSDTPDNSVFPYADYPFSVVTTIWSDFDIFNRNTSETSSGENEDGSSVSSPTPDATDQGDNNTIFGGLLPSVYPSVYGNGSVLGNHSITGYKNGTDSGHQSLNGSSNGTEFRNQTLTGYVSGTWFSNQRFIGYGNWSGFDNQSYTSHVSGTWFGNLSSSSSGNWTGFGNQSLIGYVSGTWFGNQSFTGYGKWTGLGNQSYSGYVDGTWSENQNYTGNANGTMFGNQSFASNGSGTGLGIQSTSGSAFGNVTRTTFDPDPYFQVSVPVIKKIYNDDVLLSKISPMMPITAKMAFYIITIPVALGIFIFVILCLVCLQMDCCLADRKA